MILSSRVLSNAIRTRRLARRIVNPSCPASVKGIRKGFTYANSDRRRRFKIALPAASSINAKTFPTSMNDSFRGGD